VPFIPSSDPPQRTPLCSESVWRSSDGTPRFSTAILLPLGIEDKNAVWGWTEGGQTLVVEIDWPTILLGDGLDLHKAHRMRHPTNVHIFQPGQARLVGLTDWNAGLTSKPGTKGTYVLRISPLPFPIQEGIHDQWRCAYGKHRILYIDLIGHKTRQDIAANNSDYIICD
jgi:hypothetical protein